jgi:folate-binding protein YgfZ
MQSWNEFVGGFLVADAQEATQGGRRVVARYGRVETEYGALRSGPAIVDRSYRGLLEATGKDRVAWLHNLTTNQVKTLGRGEGNYAFALNVQGRILFDMNVIVRADSVWIDMDRGFLPVARKHFEKYIIMEDVRIADRSDEGVRLALVGEGAGRLLVELGAAHAATTASLGMTKVSWCDTSIEVFRHDFCGSFAVELFVPVEQATAVWRELTNDARALRAVPAGDDAVQICRIETGIPWPRREIADEYLPAETRQLERAVSFQKGCYLGQEVVERMRSRQAVARLLCGLEVEGDVAPAEGAEVRGADGKRVGEVTSVCHSIGLGRVIALSYVKTSSASPGTKVEIVGGDAITNAVVVLLPFVGSPRH